MSGGAHADARGVVLLVGTQKGLFRLASGPGRGRWRIEGPLLAGYEVLHAWLDARAPGTGYAAVNHPVWGAHVYRSNDAGRTWAMLSAAPSHASGEFEQRLRAVWFLAPGDPERPEVIYAGIDPPGLFLSTDRGESWQAVTALTRHPSRASWEPARGGFSVHSIHVDPGDPARIYLAVSAGGAYRSDDGGRSFATINRGVRAENLPERYPASGHNIHRLVMHPVDPARLYRQCYNGTYRSDDAGDHWTEITEGLPSDFGYALSVDPNDPDTLYVIPEQSSHMRTTVDGRLRVYRSRDAGASWKALTRGLPQEHVYVTVLREAMGSDGLDPCGLYFGTSSGHLFASRDGGDRWELVTSYLPRILSVQASAEDPS